jgi:hypothetical protein
METGARVRAEQADNAISAHIGQLEDRLERRPLPPVSAMPPPV